LGYTEPPVHRVYDSFEAFKGGAHQEGHGVLVDYDSFVRVSAPDLSDPQHLYDPRDFDFRLRAGSSAIDAGVELPNITDGFTGMAPDLGAYESELPLPHYGPREP
jgi:hypothetical protein